MYSAKSFNLLLEFLSNFHCSFPAAIPKRIGRFYIQNIYLETCLLSNLYFSLLGASIFQGQLMQVAQNRDLVAPVSMLYLGSLPYLSRFSL
jgi:hypothetical protein